MASGHLGAVLRQIERLFAVGSVTGMDEGQLLERFAARRDEVAFEAMVARHGPMVLGVCRQVLRDPNDVEDAFQATFLVLVRKAGSLRRRDLLGNWLYGVAYRVALRARASSARRRAIEAQASRSEVESSNGESRPWLYEEIARLPEKYRIPIVLCYLEGQTHEEAAEHLRWPVGTVKGRLARARDLLRIRLTRRGLSLPAVALIAELTRDASAAVPLPLIHTTTKAAILLAAGHATTGLISAQALALTEGALHTMFLTKLKAASTSLLLFGVAASGAGVLAYQSPAHDADPQPAAGPGTAGETSSGNRIVHEKNFEIASSPSKAEAKGKEQAKSDPTDKSAAPADSLVKDYPKALKESGNEIYQTLLRLYTEGEFEQFKDPEKLMNWSLRIMESQQSKGETQAERRSALKDHMERIGQLLEAKPGLKKDLPWIRFYLLKAEKEWIEAGGTREQFGKLLALDARPNAKPKSGSASPAPSPLKGEPMPTPPATNPDVPVGPQRTAGAGRDGAPGQDPRSQAVLKRLNEPLDMHFSKATPLEHVLDFITRSTQDKDDTPIPIHVDRIGLLRGGFSLQSPIQLELEGVPLKNLLRLLLQPLGLTYRVVNGTLYVSPDPTGFFPIIDSNTARSLMEPSGGSFGGSMGAGLETNDETMRMNQIIAEKLDKAAPFDFAQKKTWESLKPEGLKLGDILSDVQVATRGHGGKGIPIYVDPAVLNRNPATKLSPFASNPGGIPPVTALRLMLRTLNLKPTIRDGVLFIGDSSLISTTILR